MINENLNDNIKRILNSLEINGHTEPIRVRGFLVLQLNDLKIVKKTIDPQQELKELDL